MEEAKKKKGQAYFDVVISVSVPQSYTDQPHPPTDVPNTRIQRMDQTPTKPEKRLVRDTNLEVPRPLESLVEELERVLKNRRYDVSLMRLRDFNIKFSKARSDGREGLEGGWRRPTDQKLRALAKMVSLTPRKMPFRPQKLGRLLDLEKELKAAKDDKENELQELERKIEENPEEEMRRW